MILQIFLYTYFRYRICFPFFSKYLSTDSVDQSRTLDGSLEIGYHTYIFCISDRIDFTVSNNT